MTTKELEIKIQKLKEWEALEAEAKAEVETLKDAIKAEMESRGTEELECGRFIARWTIVVSNRFDTTAFKKSYAEMYKQFTKQSTSRRFTIG